MGLLRPPVAQGIKEEPLVMGREALVVPPSFRKAPCPPLFRPISGPPCSLWPPPFGKRLVGGFRRPVLRRLSALDPRSLQVPLPVTRPSHCPSLSIARPDQSRVALVTVYHRPHK